MMELINNHDSEEVDIIFNFADGYARHTVNQDLESFSMKLITLMSSSFRQKHVEYEFGKTFFSLANQVEFIDLHRILYCPSASVSIEIIANFLRQNNLSLSLIEPTFDNLPNIMRRHGISLAPLTEVRLKKKGISSWLRSISSDAVFIVMPNNPTGLTFSETKFDEIANYCKKHNKLLILDFCYRFFEPNMSMWNQYKILEKSGIRYIVIEDTGKTWPTHELKVSSLTSDSLTFNQLNSIYHDIFLHHSPVILKLLTEIIYNSGSKGKITDILDISQYNRSLLKTALSEFPVRITEKANIPIAWLEFTVDIDSSYVEEQLRCYGIQTLSGKHFFWNHTHFGKSFLRIALMRDTELFSNGMEILHQSLSQIFRELP